MNYSEFIRQLGTDPASRDPAFLHARTSSPEFIRAAAESDHFEHRLGCALAVSVPQDLLPGLKRIGLASAGPLIRWRNHAMAAGLLLAVAVAGITWRMNAGFDSVEQYVSHHYTYDGPALVSRGAGQLADNVDEVLTRFQVALTPEARRMVGLIKICPTPSGKGAHIVLNTPHGPITVIFMPGTTVTDGEVLVFGGMQAQLVAITGGAAAVIGRDTQPITRYHALVRNSFIPLSANA